MSAGIATATRTIDAPLARSGRRSPAPPGMKQFFLGTDVETDCEVGHPIPFSGEFKRRAFEDKGEVLEFAPEHRLSLSHHSPLNGAPDRPESYHVVAFELSQAARR